MSHFFSGHPWASVWILAPRPPVLQKTQTPPWQTYQQKQQRNETSAHARLLPPRSCFCASYWQNLNPTQNIAYKGSLGNVVLSYRLLQYRHTGGRLEWVLSISSSYLTRSYSHTKVHIKCYLLSETLLSLCPLPSRKCPLLCSHSLCHPV